MPEKGRAKETYYQKGTQKNEPETKEPVSLPAIEDDVIGKTKIVYLEDPEVARKTPTRSEPLKKSR